MSEANEREDVLCGLLLLWLAVSENIAADIGDALNRLAVDAGRAVTVAVRLAAVSVPWFEPRPYSAAAYRKSRAFRLACAIAEEEANQRLFFARERLLDAATEVASLVDDGLLPPGQRPELDALWEANDEWQEAQLQAYAPREAVGLVEVAP